MGLDLCYIFSRPSVSLENVSDDRGKYASCPKVVSGVFGKTRKCFSPWKECQWMIPHSLPALLGAGGPRKSLRNNITNEQKGTIVTCDAVEMILMKMMMV